MELHRQSVKSQSRGGRIKSDLKYSREYTLKSLSVDNVTNFESNHLSGAPDYRPKTASIATEENAHANLKKKKKKKKTVYRQSNGSEIVSESRKPICNFFFQKVLIRNIPHHVGREDMLQILESHNVSANALWRFLPGKKRCNDYPPRFGRLYLDFKEDEGQAKKIIQALDGYTIPANGKEEKSVLQVIYAPYQKLPRENFRKDVYAGTLDQDAEYLLFLESLNAPSQKPSLETLPTEAEAEKPVSALVRYLNERVGKDKSKLRKAIFDKKANGKKRTRKPEELQAARTKTTKNGRKSQESAKDVSADKKTSRKSNRRSPMQKSDAAETKSEATSVSGVSTASKGTKLTKSPNDKKNDTASDIKRENYKNNRNAIVNQEGLPTKYKEAFNSRFEKGSKRIFAPKLRDDFVPPSQV